MTSRRLRDSRLIATVVGVACLALGTLAAGQPAAQPADVLTPHHVARLRSATSIAMAPDGSAIAYVLSVPRRPLIDEDGGPREELHVVAADGTAQAGPGELVFVIASREAALALPERFVPVDHAIVGIVDEVDTG